MGDERGERDRGRDALLDALAASGAALVLGPAGCGRTATLRAVAEHDGGHRRIWWCRGRHVGPPDGEAGLWGGDDGGRDDAGLVTAAAAEPTTVLVDDAHLLADPVARRLVLLAERRHDLGLRIAVARRPAAVRPLQARLDAAVLGPRGAVHLGPLTADGVARWWADERGHEPDPGAVASLVDRTGGWAELVAAELGRGLDDLVAARVALLEDEHRRVVRALAFGLPAGTGALATATGAAPGLVDAALDAARAAGLVHAGDGPAPAVAAALRSGTPAAERALIAEAARDGGPPDLAVAVARHLAAGGDRSPEAGRLFEAAASALAVAAPAEAVGLHAAALRAGRPAGPLAGVRAAALLAAGRAREAVALAADSPDASGAARVAGAGWAHLGVPDLAAESYLATDASRVLAVVPLLAAGRPADSADLLCDPPPARPDAARSLGDGAAAWAAGDVDGAFALLERSAQLAEVHGGVEAWPDSPHAVLALAAAQWLDTARAERVAGAAVDQDVGGAPFAGRHRLLLAWAALRAGRFDDARTALEPHRPEPTPRDEAVAAALAAAVALRTAEPADLPTVHRATAHVMARCAPDPFSADLAGELAHLAARVGADPESILGPLDRLAAALGEPVTLVVPLAWSRLLVAAAGDDADGARRCARRLAEAADELPGTSSAAATARLLADAAGAFADVLGGTVGAEDAARVRTVAGELAGRGLVFEASRLVGAASLRCTDAAATRSLLGDVRRLRATQVRSGPRRSGPVAELSDREREVARALLDGHTHREIGARLYISAKTVEHHVARIRSKLAATNRADLLASIRTELERVGQGGPT
jgi:DNA-binding CsgD family transcriptional regulator